MIDGAFDGGAEGGDLAGELVDFGFVGFGSVLEAGGDEELGSHLGQGAGGDCQEAKEVGVRIADLALGDVRGDRDGGPAQLGGEAESLGAGEGGGSDVDGLGEVHGGDPDTEVPVVADHMEVVGWRGWLSQTSLLVDG